MTIKKSKVLYFTYLPRSPRGPICTKFGIGCRLPDIITCAKFFVDRFKGFDFVRGQNLPLSID